MTYEYQHLITGEKVTLPERLTDAEMKEQSLKRIWSVGFTIKSTDWSHD